MAANRERAHIRAALLRKGFTEDGKKHADHDYFFFTGSGSISPIFTKLSRGSKYKDYGSQLLSKMASQLKLTNVQLLKLIDCPMSKEDYVAHLRDRGLLR